MTIPKTKTCIGCGTAKPLTEYSRSRRFSNGLGSPLQKLLRTLAQALLPIQLVKKAKGYTCEICVFNFESRYGELGKDFIEIHHLVPISELRD